MTKSARSFWHSDPDPKQTTTFFIFLLVPFAELKPLSIHNLIEDTPICEATKKNRKIKVKIELKETKRDSLTQRQLIQ